MSAVKDPISQELLGHKPMPSAVCTPEEPAPPSNLSAEAAILGAILFDNSTFDRVSDLLSPEQFYADAHKDIYQACVQLIKGGRQADGVTLHEYFERKDQMKAVGGQQYLLELLDSAAFGPEIIDYARMVNALASRRLLLQASEAIGAMALDPEMGETTGSLVAKAHDQIAIVEDSDRSSSDWEMAAKAVAHRVSSLDEALANGTLRNQGVPTGLTALDDMLGGLHKGNLIVLAGRPSMGKTALAQNIAFGAAEAGAKVGFFSQEQTLAELSDRVACNKAMLHGYGSVAYQQLRNGQFTRTDMHVIQQGLRHIPDTVGWDCTSKVDVNDVRAKARHLKRQLRGLDLIVVDYLQIMHIPRTRGILTTDAIGDITIELKAIAKDLNISVLLLSQLSRAVESREDKRPMLSDLRSSGSIEQDADSVVFAYRDEYYLQRSEPDWENQTLHREWMAKLQASRGRLDLIIPKNRHGSVGSVTTYFHAPSSTIVNKASDLEIAA